ncbi:MAG: cysteine desulfurase family protein [Anaerolineae bacterium]
MTIYLDHSATTATDPRVVEAMIPYFTEVYGNPSSTHRVGANAARAIEQARETVAAILNCRPKEILFTSGGTESDNLAVRAVAWARRETGRHLVTSPIEHGAILKTVEQLAKEQGFTRTLIALDSAGTVHPDAFVQACQPDTIFASVMYANNEIGTVQPIAELAALAHERGIIFHTDAVQAGGQQPLDVQALGVDLLSLSGHKFYGPKGVGVLFVRSDTPFHTSQTGGGQEFGLRAGTQNVPLIVGFAKALELAYSDFSARTTRFQSLRDRLITGILNSIPGSHLTGHASNRLCTHASFVFDSLPGGLLVGYLDKAGICASSASACKAGSVEPSGVLLALGCEPELASTSLRLTVGLHTTEADIDTAIEVIGESVRKLRAYAAESTDTAA